MIEANLPARVAEEERATSLQVEAQTKKNWQKKQMETPTTDNSSDANNRLLNVIIITTSTVCNT